MNEDNARNELCFYGKSMFDRGLSYGSAGNMSIRLQDGFLVTPTNGCLGMLQPDTLSKIDIDGNLLSGDPPTKEWPMHINVYKEQPSCNAIVHLHATYSTALSCLPLDTTKDLLPPITPYYLMKIGSMGLVPYFKPGSEALAKAVLEQAKTYKVMLLANHGALVADKNLQKAVFTMEELEESAKLYFLLKDHDVNELNQEQIKELRK